MKLAIPKVCIQSKTLICGVLLFLGLSSSISAQPIGDPQSKPESPTPAQLNTVSKSSKALKGDSQNSKVVINRQELIAKVQSFYAAISDFQADFKQTYTYHIYGRKKRSTGKVFFKKPARMRWDYETPTQRIFVADGKTLWVYEPEEAQVFKRDLSSAQLPIALRFMQGEAQLDQEFNITSLSMDTDQLVILSLTPKSPSPDFTMLKLKVDASNGEVKSSTLIDPTGNSNEITFVAAKVNQDLPNSGFSFTPPQGVRVIDEENSP